MSPQVRTKAVKCWLGLNLFTVLSGCGKPMTQPELIGNYVANYSAAKEKLTLLADGKFTQQVTIKSTSQILATNGTWTFDQRTKQVSFYDCFLIVLDGFGQQKKQPESGTVVLPVLRRFGKVQIGEEPTAEYKKQPNK